LQSSEELLGDDHKQLDNLLNCALAALTKTDLAEAFKRLDLFWARLAMHIRAENLHLFPSVLNQAKGNDGERPGEFPPSLEVQKAIDRLTDDHNFFMQQLSRAMKILRECSTDSPPMGEFETVRKIIGTVSERLTAHNELEEVIVYRLPARLLPREEQIALAARIQRELKNLPPRLA
jgi:iron-sulfur cluster repair protein YtfE (RIC family)